ncbi:Uncharacterized membrane protein YesL [Tessaracoccus bendigoensis DSM 12906]|uniref:Uncharacterized membrane protein YesL n=1 Tax=Tessaracoccus bendigoensis DSM 12906 TaxID=1123357 RepID=A0A1M6CZL5_9ACTN|nr:DUF624 domain-containing protein [Tessaracoccus bendigoensis]SHI66447.1 Uncharacterized membrane protein YesL [Tessaracoccus bendigoensis DSM 12906]
MSTAAKSEGGGWAVTVMRWLGWLTAPVEIGLAFLLGLLAGGVVLGFAPACRAAVAMSRAQLTPEGDGTPWRDAVTAWRSSFWSSQRRLAPWGLVALVLSTEIILAFLGVLPGGWVVSVPLLLFGGYFVRALALRVVLMDPPRNALPVEVPWRAAIVLPAVKVGSTLILFPVCVAVLLLLLAQPAIGITFGPGLVMLTATWLAVRDLETLGPRITEHHHK